MIAFYAILQQTPVWFPTRAETTWKAGWLPYSLVNAKMPDLRSLPCYALSNHIQRLLEQRYCSTFAVFWEHEENNLVEQSGPSTLIQFWRDVNERPYTGLWGWSITVLQKYTEHRRFFLHLHFIFISSLIPPQALIRQTNWSSLLPD